MCLTCIPLKPITQFLLYDRFPTLLVEGQTLPRFSGTSATASQRCEEGEEGRFIQTCYQGGKRLLLVHAHVRAGLGWALKLCVYVLVSRVC